MLPGATAVRACFLCSGPGAKGLPAKALKTAAATLIPLGLGAKSVSRSVARERTRAPRGGALYWMRACLGPGLLAISGLAQTFLLLGSPDAHAVDKLVRLGLCFGCGGSSILAVASLR
eukprot:6209868-Pleurochrysis_carterae.AAC.4